MAIFGEATRTASKSMDLTAGARYYNFSEQRSQLSDGVLGVDESGKPVSNPGPVNANSFVPHVMASWRATPCTTFNTQLSRGFRLGGINDPINVTLCAAADRARSSGRNAWKDEAAWNYEVSAKYGLFGGKGSFYVSAYTMDIGELQLTVTAGSCSSRLRFNVSKARSQGVEVEFTAQPNVHWDVAGSVARNNAQIKRSLTSTSASATGTFDHVTSRYAAIDDRAQGFGTVGLNSFGANTIGGPLMQSKFQFSAALPAYQLLNLRSALSHGRWEASVFATNNTDEEALLAFNRARGIRARVGFLTNQPRTMGLNLRLEYLAARMVRHASGSTSKICWSRVAQRRDASFGASRAPGTIAGARPPLPAPPSPACWSTNPWVQVSFPSGAG